MNTLEMLNSIQPGWTKGPKNLYTNPSTPYGAIIDTNIIDGRWFIVTPSNRVHSDLSSAAEAVEIYRAECSSIGSQLIS